MCRIAAYFGEPVRLSALLNEPAQAESICKDVLAVDPENQAAVVMLLLALTDQFRTGPAECVRHDLNPIGVLEERAARRDDLVDPRHQGGDLGEAEGDALEPGLTQVERRRVERQPMDGPPCVLVPTRTPFAA